MTPAQLATLKADILADPVLAAQPMTGDGAAAIAAAYNLPASPDFFAWATNVQVHRIYDAIVWANLTPAAAPDGTQLWLNRALLCQGKQFNVQIILQGRDLIDGSKTSVRAGLQDALTGLPSKADGTNQPAGWTAVQTVLSRKVSRVEKLFATGTGTQAVPATMTFEGEVRYQDVESARNS